MNISHRHALSALALMAATAAQAASYNTNLIKDGDAELAESSTEWMSDGVRPLFDAVEYGPNWVQATDAGPADRGWMLFVGGSGHASAYGYQLLDLSANVADIATGTVGYNLSGWLGGWLAQKDYAQFTATFYDAANNALGSATLGPVMPADRNNVSGLFSVGTAGYLPSATTHVKFELTMLRDNGSDNDGYADNLSFVLSNSTAAVPEPETYALLLAGLGVCVFAARRKIAAA